jgi:hypothetical protein
MRISPAHLTTRTVRVARACRDNQDFYRFAAAAQTRSTLPLSPYTPGAGQADDHCRSCRSGQQFTRHSDTFIHLMEKLIVKRVPEGSGERLFNLPARDVAFARDAREQPAASESGRTYWK